MDNGVGKEINNLQGVPTPDFTSQEVASPNEVSRQAIGHQAIFSPEDASSTQDIKDAIDQIPLEEAPAPPLATVPAPEAPEAPEAPITPEAPEASEAPIVQLFDKDGIRPMKEGIDSKTIEASKKIEGEIPTNPAAALEAFQDLRAVINHKTEKKAA